VCGRGEWRGWGKRETGIDAVKKQKNAEYCKPVMGKLFKEGAKGKEKKL
jgi:hypothetical protein